MVPEAEWEEASEELSIPFRIPGITRNFLGGGCATWLSIPFRIPGVVDLETDYPLLITLSIPFRIPEKLEKLSG